ncbi:hypothetical protein D3C73_15050 [compost metagenome]
MAKQKKKRTKKYSGADAAVTRPVVTRVTAANRNKIGQWWFERKKILKPVLITAGIATLLVWLIIEIIRIANGS